MQASKQNFVKKIELDLLSALLKYAVPFLDKRLSTKAKKEQQKSNLERIVENAKPKIDFQDVKELEGLLLRNVNESVKARKNAGFSSGNIFYSLSFGRQKNKDETANNYSITIKYEENQSHDKLKISVKKDDIDVYSSELANAKEKPDSVAPYMIVVTYQDNYAEERLLITYRQQLKHYMKKHIEDKEDMANRVPLKWLNILPESMMGGILGFTYLGENFMGRRADLTGKTARMVDIHESIHTPDEYETRVLTSWIMEKARSKYVK